MNAVLCVCGATNVAGSRFCSTCGQSLVPAELPPMPPPAPPIGSPMDVDDTLRGVASGQPRATSVTSDLFDPIEPRPARRTRRLLVAVVAAVFVAGGATAAIVIAGGKADPDPTESDEYRDLEAQVDATRTSVDDIDGETSGLKAEAEDLLAQQETVRTELAALQAEIDDLHADRDRELASITDHEAEVVELQAELDRLNAGDFDG